MRYIITLQSEIIKEYPTLVKFFETKDEVLSKSDSPFVLKVFILIGQKLCNKVNDYPKIA